MISSISISHNNRSEELMGRTTRVFGARVLRSGRRVWTGPALEPVTQGKHHHHLVRARPADGLEELIEIRENTRNKNGWQNGSDIDNEMDKGKTMEMDIDEKDGEKEPVKVENRPETTVNGEEEANREGVAGDRRWGKVYVRKRKREKGQSERDYNNDKDGVRDSIVRYDVNVDRKFVRLCVRRKMMKETCADEVTYSRDSLGSHRMLAVVVEARGSSDSGRNSYWIISCFLNSVLRYLRKAKLGLRRLYAFVSSEPIVRVYSAHGILFLQGNCFIPSNGICKVSSVRSTIPVFSVDFSALPFCFMHLHSRLLLRSAGVLHVHVTNTNLASIYKDNEINVNRDHPLSIPPDRDPAQCEVVTSGNYHPGMTGVLHQNIGVPKLTGKNVQLKNGRSVQKRRSSLRSKRGRPPSIFRMQRANGALASDLLRSRHNRSRFSPLGSDRQLRSSIQKHPCSDVRELKSSFLGTAQDIGAATCSANILIIESDKCYRLGGAVVALEQSESKQWSLTVRKDGIKRCSIRAQKAMRPCNINRFTRAVLWMGDSGWKLEFPNRQDWLIFKELYKECFNRNLQTPPPPSVIPVPRVCGVEGYADSEHVPFVRPDSYISVRDDELTRALVKRTANYDMDSDDEEWLNKFNSDGIFAESEPHKHLSAERFELMIDAFEKASHCNPDDFSKEDAAYSILPDLESRVVEAVFSYWSEKRKQKRSALIRVFQLYQPKKTQLIPKAIFRKKRSFKRQGSKASRGKQRTFLQAVVAEQDAIEQQNAVLKVQEAKAAVNRSEGLAIQKRQRAQLLMENADLAAYKAAMALRIAEAAQFVASTDAAASFFLV